MYCCAEKMHQKIRFKWEMVLRYLPYSCSIRALLQTVSIYLGQKL